MPEDEKTDEQNAADAAAKAVADAAEAATAAAAAAADEKAELTPEQLKAEVTQTRAEAANYRTRLREAERKLGEAKTPEEFEALRTELQTERETAERDLLVENVALKFKLPEELAELLQGKSREELEAHAEKLKKFAPQEGEEQPDPHNLRGGLNPTDRDSDPSDPGELAKKYSRRR